mgnify:CR=1 FL=1
MVNSGFWWWSELKLQAILAVFYSFSTTAYPRIFVAWHLLNLKSLRKAPTVFSVHSFHKSCHFLEIYAHSLYNRFSSFHISIRSPSVASLLKSLCCWARAGEVLDLVGQALPEMRAGSCGTLPCKNLKNNYRCFVTFHHEVRSRNKLPVEDWDSA